MTKRTIKGNQGQFPASEGGGNTPQRKNKRETRRNERNGTKRQEIGLRRSFVALYYAQGRSVDDIATLVKKKLCIGAIGRSTIGRDIHELRRASNDALAETIKSFDAKEFWARKMEELRLERVILWDIAENSGKNLSRVQALRQLKELREEEASIYARLGVNLGEISDEDKEANTLYIVRPQLKDGYAVNPDGTITRKPMPAIDFIKKDIQPNNEQCAE